MKDWPSVWNTVSNIIPYGVVAVLMMAPDVVMHSVFGLLHFAYEMIALGLETFLHHSFGLSKYHSQVVVFYFSWTVVFFMAYRIWRHRSHLMGLGRYWLQQVKIRMAYHWEGMGWFKKAKWTAIYAVSIVGLMFW